jgi:N-acetylmuramoyl-L-alanine amidase
LKFHWGLLGLLSVLLLSSPAQAGRLLFWRFEENQNRLTFSTDESVQPTAQLISEPTRLIIDLPGTSLGQPSINQEVGGAIASVRIGQFDAQTTRIVIELTPGYTLDPQRIQIRGINPTQWLVELPTPTRTEPESPPVVSARPARREISAIQATGSGFYVRLGDTQPETIDIQRSEDRRSIEISLKGVTLPSNLAEQTLPVGRYGLRQVQFSQTSNSPPEARLTLNINENSPDWWVSPSRLGGLVLAPVGGIAALPEASEDAENEEEQEPVVAQENVATIESIELGISGTQLLIKTDRSVRFQSRQLAGGVQQILIPNARLGSGVGSRLPSGRSLSRLRAQQLDSNTVVISIEPRTGYEVGSITQRNARLLTVDLQAVRTAAPPPNTNIPVPPPVRTTPTPPTPTLPTVPAGRVLVVIDPGHGGRDPGAVGIGGLREKDVILPISLEVARLLEQQGVSVLLTRSTDYFVSLEERAQMANRARGTLFVSIHANAAGRAGANGVETFYFSSGRGLAEAIQNSIIQTFDVRNRGVKQARFYVLRNTSMPSALVEVGFVTGTEDAPRLREPNYRSQMAAAIAQGILAYIQQNQF